MSAIDTIGGGNIEPRGLEEEMRSAYLDYAMSVIVGRALPDVRDGLKPVHRRVLYVMNELGPAAEPQARQVRPDRRRGDGQVPPARRLARSTTRSCASPRTSRCATRSSTATGNFGNIDGYSRGGDALHRGAARPARDRDAARPRRRHGRLRARPTTARRQEPVVLPARFPNLLVNGGSGIAVGMATNIPPHNLREVIAATIAYIDDPEIDVEGLMKHIKGPDFPTARHDPRPRRDPRRLRDRPRPRPRAGQGAHRADRPGQGGDHRHRAALPGAQGRRRRPDPEDPRPRARQEDPRDHRPARRVRPPRDADRDRAQARRDPQGRAQQALQAHADADDVRRQHGRARRQRPAHAVAARGDRPLRRPPARGHRPPHASTSCAAPRSARTCSRAC